MYAILCCDMYQVNGCALHMYFMLTPYKQLKKRYRCESHQLHLTLLLPIAISWSTLAVMLLSPGIINCCNIQYQCIEILVFKEMPSDHLRI